MRSVAVVGGELIFPLDKELLPTPTLNPDNNQALFKYLRDVPMNSQFAISVLNILLEERRTAHCKYWNKGKQQNVFKLGYVVKYHIQVQSKAEKVEVKQLSYQAQVSFQVKTALGNVLY